MDPFEYRADLTGSFHIRAPSTLNPLVGDGVHSSQNVTLTDDNIEIHGPKCVSYLTNRGRSSDNTTRLGTPPMLFENGRLL